jgi:hypothetical protein
MAESTVVRVTAGAECQFVPDEGGIEADEKKAVDCLPKKSGQPLIEALKKITSNAQPYTPAD